MIEWDNYQLIEIKNILFSDKFHCKSHTLEFRAVLFFFEELKNIWLSKFLKQSIPNHILSQDIRFSKYPSFKSQQWYYYWSVVIPES